MTPAHDDPGHVGHRARFVTITAIQAPSNRHHCERSEAIQSVNPNTTLSPRVAAVLRLNATHWGIA